MEPTKKPAMVILREGNIIKMKLFLSSLSLAKKFRTQFSREKTYSSKRKKRSTSRILGRELISFHEQCGENMSKATK